MKIHAGQDQVRRMQTAQPLPYRFIDDAIVELCRFPAHAANQPELFTVDDSSRNEPQ